MCNPDPQNQANLSDVGAVHLDGKTRARSAASGRRLTLGEAFLLRLGSKSRALERHAGERVPRLQH